MTDPHPALTPGRVAVITGGGGGIGLAVARRLVAMGLTVCLADRDEDKLRAAAASIGDAAFAVPTDVSDAQSVASLAAQIDEMFGPVSFLMNNAAVGQGGDALSNPAGWSHLLGVNLLGVLHGVQSFVPAMAESGAPGIVVNTGSKQGITTPPGDTAYNVSKAGVKVLTEGLAHTLRNRASCRVTAHLLIPGFTWTDLTAGDRTEKPAGAWTPDQVADRLFDGIARDEFYVWCEDNETTRDRDARRVLWAAQDIVDNRPALSRWHPDWSGKFAEFMG